MIANTAGRRGEEIARGFLERAGYRILAMNWRSKHGELDIIAEDRGTIVFVEVRARADTGHGSAAETIDPRKRHRLRLLANAYLQSTRRGVARAARIDVITVDLSSEPPGVQHIVSAIDG